MTQRPRHHVTSPRKTPLWVPHIPAVGDVAIAQSATACVSGHDSMGAPFWLRLGSGAARVGTRKPESAAFVSGHDFSRAALCAKSTPGFSPCRFEGAQLQPCHKNRKTNPALVEARWAPLKSPRPMQLPATGYSLQAAVSAFVSGHDSMGAAYLPGFGRCGKPRSHTSRPCITARLHPNLAQRGPVEERAFRPASPARNSPGFSPGASVPGHDSMGAPFWLRLGLGAARVGTRKPGSAAFVSGHDFSRAAICAKSTPGFSPCRFEGAQLQRA